jgi:alpha-tubulin suppressor-like RCC1 family protein
MSAGTSHCGLITTSNQPFTWGSNHLGQLGHQAQGIAEIPLKSEMISCGHNYTIILTQTQEMLISGHLPFKVSNDMDHLFQFEQLAKFDESVRVH